jgi:hypothetical protein
MRQAMLNCETGVVEKNEGCNLGKKQGQGLTASRAKTTLRNLKDVLWTFAKNAKALARLSVLHHMRQQSY